MKTDVQHYTPNESTLFSAVGVVVYFRSRILFLKRETDRTHPGAWGLPGGKVNEGETTLDAAIRETYEETGILRSPSNLTHVGDFLVKHVHYSFKYTVFVTEFHNIPEPQLNKIEHSAFGWFEQDQISNLETVPGTTECIDFSRSHLPALGDPTLFDMPEENLLIEAIAKSEDRVRREVHYLNAHAPDATFAIVIGPPGAGKTTLVRKISKNDHVPWVALSDTFASDKSSRQYNYLTKYLQGDSSWAFKCQVEAFAGRFWHARTAVCDYVIADEWIYSTLAYCKTLRSQGDLTEDEYQTLYLTYVSYATALPKAALVIVLTADPLILRRRILARGRKLEKTSHTEGYLTRLKVAFDSVAHDLVNQVPLLKIDTTRLNSDEVYAEVLTRLSDVSSR